jgi:hypothetical protein
VEAILCRRGLGRPGGGAEQRKQQGKADGQQKRRRQITRHIVGGRLAVGCWIDDATEL